MADGINSYHRDDRAVVGAAVKDAFDNGVPFDLDARVVTATGNTVHVHTIGRPEVVDGRTVTLWGTIQDITVRKAREAELARTANRLKMVLDTAPDGEAMDRLLDQLVAAKLGMGPEENPGVSYGAMIHDIGKMAVPAEILNRPGKLTDLEFKMIKNHSVVGAEIISGVEFPWPVLATPTG